MNDIQKLINLMFPFVETLLKDYGEFYPFAAVLNLDETIEQIEVHDGDDNPKSATVLENLTKKIISSKEKIKAVVCFFDVFVKEENTSAVAVKVEHLFEKFSFIFYYPYILDNEGNLNFQDPWKTKNESEIFN